MSFRIHHSNPADAVEQAFFRIQRDHMADVPILNPALSVEAVDFQRWQGHWLGIVVTPWCMSLLLIPGSAENWVSTGENKRRFVNFAAGDFAFLGSAEEELGEYQSCSLFSPMGKFTTQSEASLTARASISGLLTPPAPAPPVTPGIKSADSPSLSRRGFFSLKRPKAG
ncbi:MAG: [NiFe]-hydrogenase assembly chaperone HybE [Betaproteobacteria bacterium]